MLAVKRRLRYRVATSLDGYIAGPNALFALFDTAVMGWKTFLAMLQ